MENLNLYTIIYPAAIFLFTLLLLAMARSFFFRAADRLFEKTETTIDNQLLETFKVPSIFIVVATSIYITVSTASLPDKISVVILGMLDIALTISITLVLANVIGAILAGSLGKAGIQGKTTGLFQGVVKTAIYILGALVVLGNLGIAITPILTTLGVGGLAVALALQNSLGNLFAGIHLLLEQPVRVGDDIMLDSGERGKVVDIGWRTVKIKVLGDNLLIIPNGRFAESVITNYTLFGSKMYIKIPFGVDYATDIDHLESVVLDVTNIAIKSGDVTGLLSEPEPFLRFSNFGDSSIDFTLFCHIDSFNSQFEVADKLRRRLFKRFNIEGINIPFPIRTVLLNKNKNTGLNEKAGAGPAPNPGKG